MPYQEPEFLPWDGRRVPITFVGGYLGSGKTTAINEVLSVAQRPIGIIVNDAGSINIDAALIRDGDGDAIELTDGCVCCTSIDDMGEALNTIRDRPEPPDHLVIELSGVAEPRNVIPWGSSAGFVLDGVVTVVAADQILDDALPDWIRAHIDTGIAAADLLVLSKSDLVDATSRRAALERLAAQAPGTPIIDGSRGAREAGALGRFLALGGHHGRDIAAVPGPTLFDLHETHTLTLPPLNSAADVEDLLADLPTRFPGRRVVRAKGVVRLGDDADDGLVLIQVVGARSEIRPLFDAERRDPTDLVVITIAAD